MATLFAAPATRTEIPLLIAFADLSRYMANASRLTDADLAEVMQDFYVRVCGKIAPAGGAVVKFIGDAAMIVFPEDLADAGVVALLDLKEEIDAWLARRGWRDSSLVVKAHFGTAIAGPYGPPERGQVDVIGKEVNVAATLQSRTFAISAAAFRKLSPETRTRFRKHTPPITYIPAGDPRP